MYKFNRELHIHTINGVQVPGPTWVLKALGFINYPNIPGMDKYMHRGTYVHHACHLLNINDLDESSILPEYAGYINAWRSYRKDHPSKIISSEFPVYSKMWMYAGIVDAVTEDEIIDIKTSKIENPSWKYQIAAYRLAYQEMEGRKIPKRTIVQLFDKGQYKVIHYTDKNDERNWLTILSTYKLLQKDGLIKPSVEIDE